ncbi:hypothetical protein ACWCPQ_33655 [Nocardia sp. NPDC001965]
MTEHELKFPIGHKGDRAAEAKIQQLLDDPDVFNVSRHERSDGDVVKYSTLD